MVQLSDSKLKSDNEADVKTKDNVLERDKP